MNLLDLHEALGFVLVAGIIPAFDSDRSKSTRQVAAIVGVGGVLIVGGACLLKSGVDTMARENTAQITTLPAATQPTVATVAKPPALVIKQG